MDGVNGGRSSSSVNVQYTLQYPPLLVIAAKPSQAKRFKGSVPFFPSLSISISFKVMWKLKIAEGGSPWLRTLNNHVGRQVWEFDPNLGSPQDLSQIDQARQNFHDNRFTHKHSADLLMRMQVYTLSSSHFISSHLHSI